MGCMWLSIPADSRQEQDSVPSRFQSSGRLIGIIQVPDSSWIKSHLEKLSIGDRIEISEADRTRE